MIVDSSKEPLVPALSFVDKFATFLYALIPGVIPFLFIPTQLFSFPTISSEILLAKEIGTRLLCGVIILLGSIKILTVGFYPLVKYGLFPITVFLYSLFTSCSVLNSSNSSYSLRYFYSELFLLLSILLIPYFIHQLNQVRVLVFSTLVSTLLCALFSWSVWFTKGESLVLVYGANVRDLLFGGGANGAVIEGGIRSLYMSTLGNPEFTGNYLAIGVVLSGLFAWNQFGFSYFQRKPYLSTVLGLCMMLINGVAMLLTQTRGSLLILAFCGLLWFFLQLRFSVRYFALGILLSTAAFFLGSSALAIGLFGGFLIIMVGLRLRIEGAFAFLRSFKPQQQFLVMIMLCFLLLGILSALFVPQVQNRLIPLAQRISSAGSVNDRSIRERLLFYTLASEMVVTHPILGVGPGMYPAQFHDSLTKIVAADESGVMAYNQLLLQNFVAYETHNDLFQITSEQGVLGISAFLLMIAAILQPLMTILRNERDSHSSLALVLLVALFGYLVMMLMSFPLQEPARCAHFFGLITGGYALLVITRNQSNGLVHGRNSGTPAI